MTASMTRLIDILLECYNENQNARPSAQGDAARHNITNRACSSVKNAVPSACVSLLATMATKVCAPATTTGRPSVEDPSAPRLTILLPSSYPLNVIVGMVLC
uniref:Uncharacterized protein n=1 Tax=Rhizophora mucronata TaxID=61149 RepID=A0A2P2IZZ9_RHIMU